MASPVDSAVDHCSGEALHSLRRLRRTNFNRLFAGIYACAIFYLFYHHTQNLINSTAFLSFSTDLTLLLADIVLAFMWLSGQSFRMRPVRRQENLKALEAVLRTTTDSPKLDVFICTADPYKEPPMSVVNTALSVMGYDYPTDKISVYVSDDGGSALTLYAFLEAARFASHWLPFCRDRNIMDRSPEIYFSSNNLSMCSETQNIKMIYENMKERVERVLKSEKVCDKYLSEERDRQIFDKWTDPGFNRRDHPAVIQVLLESGKDRDISGHSMPNLIYVSREKSKSSPHNFKAGALNALVRVSGVITNAPLILTLDCDTYSNDPSTPSRTLCYFSDPQLRSDLAFVQFPQCFHSLNKSDIYNAEMVYLFKINPLGMDGLRGPNYVGAGCFFRRRCFFGPPSGLVRPQIPELSPDHVMESPVRSEPILELAHKVAGYNFENNTTWGSKMGFRYGSLVEDFNTGYHLQCEGWNGIFCDPERPAFYGDIPITLIDSLNQVKRWSIGLLEVSLSKFSPITYGFKKLGPIMALTYGHYAFWPFWSFPIIIYAFLPQLYLLNGLTIFPKVSDPMFLLYTFLVIGSYTQHYVDIALNGGTFKRWFCAQRMWMIRCITSFIFGSIEFTLKAVGFNVTSKVLDDEQSKRYDQGVFEFGVASPMFVPLTMVAIVNLVSFLWGIKVVAGSGGGFDFVPQLVLSGFVALNCWPVYEAMVLRSDKGKIPTKITLISSFLVFVLFKVFTFIILN